MKTAMWYCFVCREMPDLMKKEKEIDQKVSKKSKHDW